MGDSPKTFFFLTFPTLEFRTAKARPQLVPAALPMDGCASDAALDLPFPEPDEVAPLLSSPGLVTPNPAAPPEKHFNYYSYFSEVEAAFTAHRGKPYRLSPLDWALVESWQKAGIPLPVVLRAIAQACAVYAKRMAGRPKRRLRPIRSLAYCQPFVEEAFDAYQASQVGAAVPVADADAGGFSRTEVAAFLETSIAMLSKVYKNLAGHVRPDAPHARLGEVLPAAIARLQTLVEEVRIAEPLRLEAIEMTLSELEDRLLAALYADVPPEVRDEAAQAATALLKPHRKSMATTVYEQTHANDVARRLRERYGLPRLSLFYLGSH